MTLQDPLAQSERHFRALIEMSPDIVVELSDKGVVGFVSPSVERILGYAPGEVLGRPFMEFVHPDEMSAARGLLATILRDPATPLESDLRYRHKDGRWITLHAVGRNLLKEDAVRAIVVRALDVTQSKAVERALLESEAKFSSLVGQAISGIYIIQDGKFAYVNPHFGELFGYSPRELVGVPFQQLVAETDRELVAANIRRRLDKDVKTLRYSFTGLRKDGTTFAVGVQGTLAEYGGRPAIIGILQDISERLEAEKRERLYAAQLEHALLGTVDAVSGMLERRDPYTAGHEQRVARLAASIGANIGMAAHEIKALSIIGSIHDIGKIAVPAEILSKPTRLTTTEFDLIKVHSQVGHDLLKTVEFPWPVARTILEHHERLDGSGYPLALQGQAISPLARVLAVADVVEAMASHRPYRPALGIGAALSEVEKHSGKLYDSTAVAGCLDLFRNKQYRLDATSAWVR